MSDIINLEIDEKNKVTVHLHGATITSFFSEGQEILFVSEKSVFDNKKAIRGGIPVVFPNFGPWACGPQHGFARTKKWSVKPAICSGPPVPEADQSQEITLILTDDEATRAIWDFKFELWYIIKLTKGQLETRFIVRNTGDKEFDFTSLLHTYIRLDNVDNATVSNLVNLEYTDKVKQGILVKENNELVKITGETDRVYYTTPNTHTIITGNENKLNIVIEKDNFPETVVWNPWIEKAKSMADFGDDEYKKMICVEAGYLKERYVVKPADAACMVQKIIVQKA